MEPPNDLLTPEQTASIVGLSPDTLKKWRKEGAGPAFIRLGHRTVRYRRASVLAWLQESEKTSSSKASVGASNAT